MRPHYLLILPAIFFLVSCGNNASTVAEETADTVETTENMNVRLQEHFPKLFAYYQQQDTSFPNAGFEGGELETKDTLRSTPIDTAQLRPYKPYLVYNHDSTKAIDFVSYNYVLVKKNGQETLQQGGPDAEVALLDFTNHSRKRILFMGSSATILNSDWDGNEVLIAGAEDLGDEKVKPTFWIYNIGTGTMEIYNYNTPVKADIKNYTEQLLNVKPVAKTIPSF
ncbi:MAG TPA: hypothetical protein VJ499_16050 [Flavisolibacter sp.]|nr:hypothetical protein [Flavisolibacter sp.]